MKPILQDLINGISATESYKNNKTVPLYWWKVIDECTDEEKLEFINMSPATFRNITHPTEEMIRLHAIRWKI